MANRIKGITIAIDGDTSKFQKALKDVDKDLRSTQNQLKDVNRLLKLDPKNTELLTQKQRALKDAISQTKERLNTLKEAEKQAAEQLKNGDIGQKEYDALQREIAETEQSLKQLKKQQSDFASVAQEKLKVVGQQFQAVGDKVKTVGDNMTKYVTGPLAAIGGASVAAFKNIDDGYDQMIAKTGATGEAADELRGIMNDILSTVPTDANTAGNAIGEVATRFNVAGDDLEHLSTLFVKFSDLNNTDVVSSVDKVQKALASYGLGAESAEGYLDRLNAVGQQTGVSTDKLAEGIVSNGAAFHELGLTLDEATVFMGQLETSGANSETVLNGMRKALKNATKEGVPLDQALSDLQNTIVNDTGSMEGLNAAYDLFGKSGDQIYDAIKNGTLDFNALGQALQDVSGNVNNVFGETQDPLDEFQITLNRLKITGAEIGASLLDVLAPAIEKLADFFTQLKEKWDSLSPAQQDMIVKIGLVVAALGPLISIIGSIISMIGTVMGVIGMISAPVLGVIAIIAAAIAIGVLLYKNWDTIKANNLERNKELLY